MPLLHIAILALVQGVTEFLPISSSGHLVLLPLVMDWPDQGRVLDVAVHVGTLVAVVAYAHREVARMILAAFSALRGKGGGPGLRLLGQVLLASIPVIVAGYLVARYSGDMLRDPRIIACFGWQFPLVSCGATLAPSTRRSQSGPDPIRYSRPGSSA